MLAKNAIRLTAAIGLVALSASFAYGQSVVDRTPLSFGNLPNPEILDERENFAATHDSATDDPASRKKQVRPVSPADNQQVATPVYTAPVQATAPKIVTRKITRRSLSRVWYTGAFR